jgi:hypothetical protein
MNASLITPFDETPQRTVAPSCSIFRNPFEDFTPLQEARQVGVQAVVLNRALLVLEGPNYFIASSVAVGSL